MSLHCKKSLNDPRSECVLYIKYESSGESACVPCPTKTASVPWRVAESVLVLRVTSEQC